MILLSPGPANTTDTVKQAMTRPDICPREREFGEVLRRVRDGLTRVVHRGGEYTTVLFCGSGTAGVEATISSTVGPDGRLLVIDNGAYGERMASIAAAYDIPCDVEPFGAGGVVDLDRVTRALERRPYSHLAVVHHETSTGMLNPVAAVGRTCRGLGVEMIVDAISSYAGLPIDVEEMAADYLVASAAKCLQGMAGLSFAICRTARLEEMRPLGGRSLYLSLPLQHRFFEHHGQMRYTPPVQVVYALEQALDELFTEGCEARHRRYIRNWETLDGGMRDLGFRRLLSAAVLSRLVTAYLSPDHESYTFAALHDRLFARGYTIYPGTGTARASFRLANIGAVTPDDMEAFLGAMKDTLVEMKVKPLYGDRVQSGEGES